MTEYLVEIGIIAEFDTIKEAVQNYRAVLREHMEHLVVEVFDGEGEPVASGTFDQLLREHLSEGEG